MSLLFIDGTGITPRTEECKCDNECEFPCWQRLGWAPSCDSCGCEVDTAYKAPGRQVGPLHFQRNAWGGIWISWRRNGAWSTITLFRPNVFEIDR